MTALQTSDSAAPTAPDRRHAWVTFAVIFFASAVAPFNQAKVPPLIPVLVDELSLSLVEAGLLMSVFASSGLLLALPAGLLYKRMGPKGLGLIAVGSMALGSLLGSAAPNGGWLLATRLLEGIGMGIVVVTAMATIVAWFPAKERGLPLGLFSAWIPVGTLGMLLLAPAVYEALGWRAVWLVAGAFSLALLVLYAWLVDLPTKQPQSPTADTVAWHHGIDNPAAWLLSFSFACYQFLRVGLLTWAPTYLITQTGLGLTAAAHVTGLNQAMALPTCIVAGWLMVRIPSRRWLYTVSWLALLPIAAVLLEVASAWFTALFVAAGAAMALLAAAINAATPETARGPEEVGPVVGIVAIGRNAGQMVAPVVLAVGLETTGAWTSVTVALVVVSVAGLVSGWLVRVR